MLLQTNSYVVPKEQRVDHARLMRKFRQTMTRLGCDQFEVYEQVASNWSSGEPTGRYVQIMRFRDRKHQLEVQEAERNDPGAQQLIQEFCDLVNIQYQQGQGMFAVGFYSSVLPVVAPREHHEPGEQPTTEPVDQAPPGFQTHDQDAGPVVEVEPTPEPSPDVSEETAENRTSADLQQ